MKDNQISQLVISNAFQKQNESLKRIAYFKLQEIEKGIDEDNQVQQYNDLIKSHKDFNNQFKEMNEQLKQKLQQWDICFQKRQNLDQQYLENSSKYYNDKQIQFERVQKVVYDQQQIEQVLLGQKQHILQKEELLEIKKQQIAQRKQEIYLIQQRIQNLKQDILGQQNETIHLSQLQRQWNNELQEQKGNIRVYCRIRPFEIEESAITTNGDCTINLQVPKNFHKSENYLKTYQFNFEHIFGQNSTQNQIYIELSQLIENVIDGHNVCIFAYGQTGSGKTYTMQGQPDFDQRGVIPRSVDQIFDRLESLTDIGWKFIIKIGFQEIYNESIKDLFTNQKNEEIQMTDVKDKQMVHELFSKAMENRSVAETQCNEFSSRSHFIFQLNVQGQLISTVYSKNYTINSTLNLIDLAGSERLNLVKTEGDRLKETQCINRSLTALGDVINALATKNQFVPYRNSKLTHVLQKYLEGSSKTLMLVNISPKLEDFAQTLQSLRFADKVKNCKVGNQNQAQLNKKI